MKDFGTLIFLDRFKGLFERFGIDYSVMRRILQIKFLMDGRRVPTLFNQSGGKRGPRKDVNYFIRSLWMYALLGLIIVPFILLGTDYMFQMSLVFAMMMFIVMTSMISDFSSVLLDIRDKDILNTKPVSPRTLSMAKTIHISVYLFFLTAAVMAVPLIVGCVTHGFLFLLIFAAEIILADLLVVFLTALLYFLILRFFDGEKLKDLINYVQIGLSIAVFVGYQVVIHAFDFVNVNMTFKPAWWDYLLPPMWFGAPFEWLLNGHHSAVFVILSLLALFAPMLSIFIYLKLTPAFERNLQKLAEHGSIGKKDRRRRKLTLAHTVCWNKEERVFFRFAGYMMNQEREFKLKVYPALGFSMVLPFIFLFNQIQLQSWSSLPSSKWYLSIYGCLIVIPTVSMMLNYSGTYKGAWIFKSAPIQNPLFLYRGTLKASLAKLFLPVYVVVGLVFIGLFGLQVIPQLIVALLSAFIYALICFKVFTRTIPFSEAIGAVEQTGGWRLLPLFLLIAVFVTIHSISLSFAYGVYLYMVILILVNILAWGTLFKTSWAEV